MKVRKIKMNTELEKYNLIYQKIGRNVFLFQKIELVLRYLAATSHYSGCDANEILKNLEKQLATTSKKTMGLVAGQFVENIYGQADNTSNAPEELKDIWFSFDFKIQDEDYNQRKKALESIIAERNELIHHFVSKWKWNSIDDFREAEKYLDYQHEKTKPEFDNLRALWENLKEHRKIARDWWLDVLDNLQTMSEELRESQSILLLGKISRQHARADGWTMLSMAAQYLQQNVPGEMTILKKRYKTLKNMMLLTGLFDLCEEPTKKGGNRLLYRVKSGFSLWAKD